MIRKYILFSELGRFVFLVLLTRDDGPCGGGGRGSRDGTLMGRREERFYRRDSCSERDRGRGDGCGTGGAATTVFLSGERNI